MSTFNCVHKNVDGAGQEGEYELSKKQFSHQQKNGRSPPSFISLSKSEYRCVHTSKCDTFHIVLKNKNI